MPAAKVIAKIAFAAVLILSLAPFANIQAKEASVVAAVPSVQIGGDAIAAPLHLSMADLASMPRSKVTASEHGTQGTWEGVSLIELLHRAGAPVGEAIRGKNLALYVRISAADGYRAVFALAELDAQFRSDQVILADSHDGKSMDAKEGPFRIIASGDQRPARWVRQVTAIDLLRAP
ncbi:molybdopterin-binding protein [Pseudolysobacter antarcticus]|uniref:Molybdopterin-binding protein n=1 Tax=Pseudolysobacter antarcticus TaxID=2511995 RepID=A0A411HH00_9GAMM|nr:molybdopterin-dependent oxidoreductase [Pseudolysobacter antarcticus]QBB69769.1 molybdopterin-binding protein [Pseudolysobacter antarcticus]